MKSGPLFDLLRATLGDDAVELDPEGLPRVLPGTTDAVAETCALAFDRGLRVRIEGNGTWMPSDAWADFALSTARMARPLESSTDGLVATVAAGVRLDQLGPELGGKGGWLPLDPPGLPERTVGSIVATGTAGPLHHGFGMVRDQLLDYTLVTGDGGVHHLDLRDAGTGQHRATAGIGTFGAFGIVTQVRFRLVPYPEARMVMLAAGDRDSLTRQARELAEEGIGAAALELWSPVGPGAEWSLVLELAGPREQVEAEAARARVRSEVTWEPLSSEQATRWRSAAAIAPLNWEVTLRIGVLPDGLDPMLDLLAARLGWDLVSAGAGRGGLRWSGEPRIPALREVRHACAEQEVPLTLERAPWDLRRSFGHYGAYHEGPGRRDVSPDPTFAVVLEAATG